MPPEDTATRGRQAEARRNDTALLEAARDVFGTLGPDAPVAAIAERAGVGIGSLYRRYGSKVELQQQLCLMAVEQAQEAARAGLAEADPWEGLAHYVRACVGRRRGALAVLAGRIPITDELRQAAEHARAMLGELVTRSQAHGGLRQDVTPLDIAWLIEQLARRPPDGLDAAEEAVVRARLVALVLDGLRADGATPLPVPEPRPEAYFGRWRTGDATVAPPA